MRNLPHSVRRPATVVLYSPPNTIFLHGHRAELWAVGWRSLALVIQQVSKRKSMRTPGRMVDSTRWARRQARPGLERAGSAVAAPVTPALAARLAAGFDVPTAARKLRISQSYLRQCERYGPSLLLLEKMAALYKCRIDSLVVIREGVVWYKSRHS